MSNNLNIRIPDEEIEILKDYCNQSGRTQTEVIRGFIRSLEHKIRKIRPEDINPLFLPKVTYDNRLYLPEVSGLYFVISSENVLLYIGRSKNIRQRWIGRACAKDLKFDLNNIYIAWLELSQRKTDKDFEKSCIQQLKPSTNIQFTEKEKDFRQQSIKNKG